MRVLLIYNPTAGDGVDGQRRALIDRIHAAGHEVRCRSSKDPHMTSALTGSVDLVVIAGGDGTIAKVARRLRGRDLAIAALPLGTANNIATALGLADAELETLIRGWSRGRTIAMDLGVVRGPRGMRSFLESVGVGLLPQLMTARKVVPGHAPTAEARVALAVARARKAAQRLPAIEVRASLDGRDLSGRYLLLEAMNIGWVGPRLNLADTDPADGQFDVVFAREDDRDALVEWLAARERGADVPRALPALRGRRFRIDHGRFGVHVDDKVWAAQPARSEPAPLEATLESSIRFRLPASEAAEESFARDARWREALEPRGRNPRRFELTSSRWAWPAGGPARSRRSDRGGSG
ncbi:MAG TPA: diacylglycerol kinase family protein [Casimicrobiaceae bacterium]|nr:diacylglycerol kinase family protein [Casimicrobiaceae bacterium]